MQGLAAVRGWSVSVTILIATLPALANEADSAVLRTTTVAPSNIVIGFVGGFVGHDNAHHGPVVLARRIRPIVPKNSYVRIFENRRRKRAYETILRLLDTDHDGTLSEEEKARARIILFGQSWGASAAVVLARELRREGVPVLLTVQVDSVRKFWQNDAVIPDNVAEAINFYQPHGIIHGRAQITAADPARTEILGNYRMDYRKDPVQCPEASWFDRVFTPGHMESECDPHLWSQIEDMVKARLGPFDNPPTTSAGISVQADADPEP